MPLFLNAQEIINNAQIINRVSNHNNALNLEWSGSGFYLKFSGDYISVEFENLKTEQPIYIRAEVDGGCSQIFSVSTGREVLKCADLENGEHILKLIRITEPRRSDADPRLIISRVTIMGIGAEVLPLKMEEKRKITFIGDSITCGWGVYGECEGTGYASAQQDVTKTYAYRIIREFDLDYQIVARSGQGIVCSCDGERGNVAEEFFEYESPFLMDNYDHSKWNPDLVIINLGTNDSAGRADHTVFYETAKRFLKRIRECYRDAKIIWTYGAMGGIIGKNAQKAIEDLGDENIFYYGSPEISREIINRGVSYHPNVRGQKVLSDLLIDFIKQNNIL